MLDLMMPETDGFEVVDQLRRDAATADIPVVIVTAKDLTSEDRDRLRAGVVTVLQKGSDSGVDVSRIVRATKLALVETGRIAPQRREPETA
jgi:CheY-like chemotaxis protein